MRIDYLGAPFIESLMRRHAPENDIRVMGVRPLEVDSSASILAALTAGTSEKTIGHFGLAVSFESRGVPQTRRMVLKVKPPGGEIVRMLGSLAAACGGKLAETYPAYQWLTGFQHTHARELEVYGQLSDGLFPELFGLHADLARGTYAILMEYLEGDLLNSVMTPGRWSDGHLRQALGALASWHARHLDQALPLNPAYWNDAPSRANMVKLTPLWEALLDNAAAKFPELYPAHRVNLLQEVIEAIPAYWQELEAMPKTLVHNDLNPRNVCFKPSGDSVECRPFVLCAYDWELATYHVPQYDVVELLCFVLEEDRYGLRPAYLEFYRQALHQRTGRHGDAPAFQRGFELAARDFGLHRLGMYLMAHAVGPYPFLPRVVNSYFNTLTQFRS